MSLRKLDSLAISPPEDTNTFYMSFGDLMVILCCFFVLMHSISKVDKGSFERLRTEFTGSSENSLVELAETLTDMTKDMKEVSISFDKDGVRINMESAALFESSSAVLKSGALVQLKPIIEELKATSYTIDVEGHTDDQGLYRYRDKLLETNWSLSGLRASTVVHHLLEMGLQEDRLRIIGYASNHPAIPVTGKEGDELEKARAANRRVSLLVH